MASRFIRLYTCEPCIITAAEYAEAYRTLLIRHTVGDVTIVDRIVARLLLEHKSRYYEIKDDVDAYASGDIDLEILSRSFT